MIVVKIFLLINWLTQSEIEKKNNFIFQMAICAWMHHKCRAPINHFQKQSLYSIHTPLPNSWCLLVIVFSTNSWQLLTNAVFNISDSCTYIYSTRLRVCYNFVLFHVKWMSIIKGMWHITKSRFVSDLSTYTFHVWLFFAAIHVQYTKIL